MQTKAENVTWHHGAVTADDRERRNGHQGAVVWFTGLSACGKSTIAVEVEKKLFDMGVQTFILDGDNIRHGLNKNLGFSPQDREENIRRIGEVAKLFCDAGMVALTAFISPYRRDRDAARALVKEGRFIEIHVKADIETCKQRDPKGLYQKAIEGKIPEFTGISAPYEEPLSPELVIDTARLGIEQSAQAVLECLRTMGIVGG
jgi:adenylylsulfate kinase